MGPAALTSLLLHRKHCHYSHQLLFPIIPPQSGRKWARMMQVNRGCLDNKHARTHLPDGESTAAMIHQQCRCLVTVPHMHACPLSGLVTAQSRSNGSILARVALRHTDNGGGGSLKACSGRWISYNLLLLWASNIQEQPVFMQFVSRRICVGHGDMHWHVFLGRVASVMELPFYKITQSSKT